MRSCLRSRSGPGGLERLRSARPETTFSAGIASWDGQESTAELIARADEALYSAKNAGRNRIVVLPSARGDGLN